MAGYIKGITIEFGADTSKLNGALKKTQGTLNKTQAELKQINNALKFNPGNTTLLRQKFELLQRSVTETRTKLKQLKDMQRSMDAAGIDKNSAQYRELEREIVKTTSQLKQAEGALKRFGSVGKQQALAVGQAFKTAGGKIKSAGRTITTSFSVYGMAGIYAGSRLIEMSEKQAQAEQKLAEIYKTRMGVGKQAVASTLQLASAQQKAGVIGDEVQLAAAQQLATYAQYPSTVNTMLPALNNLLVQQKGLNGTQEDATALANLFGKAMMGQTGALKRAGISFNEAQEQVLKYGTEEEKAAMIAEVVTQNVGNMNAEFAKTDAGKIQQAKNELGDMGEEIGAILLPAVADLVSWFQQNLMPVLQKVIDYFKQHPAIAKFALAFAGIMAVLGPLIMILGSLVSMIGGVISIAAVLGPVIGAVAAPVLGVVAAIAAAIAIGVALYKNWDVIKAKAKAVFTAIKTTVTTNFNTLKNTVTTVWNTIKNAITKPIETAKQIVQKAVNKIKGFFPLKLGKLVSFFLPKISVGSIAKKIGEKLTHAPKFSVGGWTKYAKAMNTPYLFTKPTGILAGEAGDEMIYGRSNLMKDIEAASGGGMDYGRLAAAIVGALSGVDGNIVLNIDGKQMAQAQAPYMNIAINQVQARQNRQLGLV